MDDRHDRVCSPRQCRENQADGPRIFGLSPLSFLIRPNTMLLATSSHARDQRNDAIGRRSSYIFSIVTRISYS